MSKWVDLNTNGSSLSELPLEFEAFASDIFKDLKDKDDDTLKESGVVAERLENAKEGYNSIVFRFIVSDTVYELERRKTLWETSWSNATYSGRYYSKSGSGDSFNFKLSKELVFSEVVITEKGVNRKNPCSMIEHCNRTLEFGNKEGETLVHLVEVSPLHTIKFGVDGFEISLGEEDPKRTSNNVIAEKSKFYGYISCEGGFLNAIDIGRVALAAMRTSWSIVYQKLGIESKPGMRVKKS